VQRGSQYQKGISRGYKVAIKEKKFFFFSLQTPKSPNLANLVGGGFNTKRDFSRSQSCRKNKIRKQHNGFMRKNLIFESSKPQIPQEVSWYREGFLGMMKSRIFKKTQ